MSTSQHSVRKCISLGEKRLYAKMYSLRLLKNMNFVTKLWADNIHPLHRTTIYSQFVGADAYISPGRCGHRPLQHTFSTR